MTRLNDRLARANQRFEFTSEACGPDTFAVVRMQGFEAISKPYRFELVLVSDEARLDLAAVLAAGAHFGIHAPDDARRTTPYAGMLAEFDQLHQAGGFTFYRAVLVPRLWQLSLYRNSEVYLHEQTIPEIVEGLLKSARLHPGNDYQLKLTGSYRARSYVCQYQETPLDFISRWLEKEGIYYHFAQVDGHDRLVLLDDRIAQAPEALAVSYRPADELDTGIAPDSVQAFLCRARPLPARVVLQDFNHRRAGLPLVASAEVSAAGLGEEMIYGENFRTPEEGERYARLRAQERLCGARVFNAEATAVGLRAGAFMELSHHYRQDFDGRYLVTEITHEGSQAGALLAGLKTPYNEREGQIAYRNSFVALPAGVQFRPARVTPKPRVAGTMNATIDAEGSGELAELDDFGQYKVQLPFDRTDKAAGKGSARVRMATPYSGSDHGMHFPLHKNAEVLLAFTDGDPDQPTIVGTVPNSANASVVTNGNANDNRIATRGGNQLYMSDVKGKESTWLHSPYHNSSIALGSIDPKGGGSLGFFTAGSSEAITIGNKAELTIGAKNTLSFGTDTTISAALSNKLSIGATFALAWQGDVKWTPEGARSWSVDDSDNTKLSVNSEQFAQESIRFTAGTAPTGVVSANALKTLKGRVRAAVGGMIATNLAIGAACTGVLAGKSGSEKQNMVEKTEGDKKIKSHSPWVIGTSFANIGANVLSSVVGIGVLRSYMTKFAEAQKALAYVSDLKLDAKGIAAQASGTTGQHAQLGLGERTVLRNIGGGDRFYAFPPLPLPDMPKSSYLELNGGEAELRAGTKLTLGASMTPGNACDTTLELDPNGMKVEAPQGSVELLAKFASLTTHDGANGFGTGPHETRVQHGQASITMTSPGNIELETPSGTGIALDAQGIRLSAPGQVQIKADTALTLDASGLIKLG